MNDIDKNYVRAFSTPAGRAVLAHLRKITIERMYAPNATDNELRWGAAQSALVHQIIGMISRGQNNE